MYSVLICTRVSLIDSLIVMAMCGLSWSSRDYCSVSNLNVHETKKWHPNPPPNHYISTFNLA